MTSRADQHEAELQWRLARFVSHAPGGNLAA